VAALATALPVYLKLFFKLSCFLFILDVVLDGRAGSRNLIV